MRHVRRVVFEYTTRCNLACNHCFLGPVPVVTDDHPDVPVEAARVFCRMGIREFAFIGGEVALFGHGWLRVARTLAASGAKVIGLVTNGTWAGLEQPFEAAGRLYGTERDYLDDLRSYGVTDVAFSLDGEAEVHDRSRGVPGLHDRILAAIPRVREAGLTPRVSLVLRPETGPGGPLGWVASLASRLYGSQAEGSGPYWEAARLLHDPYNIVSSVIDIGRGARVDDGSIDLHTVPEESLSCKALYRPYPSLTIKANGAVSACRLPAITEDAGNLHRLPLVEILNHLDESFSARLHREQRVGEVRDLVDPEVFGTRFTHMCTLRVVLTLLARRLHELGISPDDLEGVRRANREVAALTGHDRVR